ncbi:hypothetical protein Psuf_065570 [Phytohabitans suffuscus]|uniref:Penicillin amidase n=1 Tax=Phytohabitans suffuscus TaxID=624315 RepID=A0A6F8YT03_9ACTN|nr:hypothetical protein Psuf_065570 [Phytohabitans suffuscus]
MPGDEWTGGPTASMVAGIGDVPGDSDRATMSAGEPRHEAGVDMSDQDLRRDNAPAGQVDADSANLPGGEESIDDAVSPADRETGLPASGARRRRWRRARRVLLWCLAVFLTLAVTASALLVWTVRRSFPDYDSTITMPGLGAPVTAYRDEYGIPQLYASSELDLFKAQGYVHAQDRFWEMDFRRHLTSGRLAELFGPSMVPTDAFLRTLGWREVAAREWQLVSPQTRAYLQAYADGVNAWIAGHGGSDASGRKSLEYPLLSLLNPGYTVERWDPVDSIASLKAMAWDLASNKYLEMDRSVLLSHGLRREQIDELFPAYPFDRNSPILSDGAVVNGAFDATATPTSPAAPGGAGAVAVEQAWRSDAAPVFGALRGAVAALKGRLGVTITGVGSNSWVVSGELTASGKPLLANDPHVGPSIPGMWYQVGLHCSCTYDVAGFSLSGLPGVLIGHNDRISWGFTNLAPDVTDFYLEKVDGNRYYDGAGWRALTTREEVIEVAGREPVTVTVRSTGHGPLLSDRSADLLG